jgi:general transcription factor 3C polypeptide 5 (transcription factor C subunit 1)
MVEKDIPKIPTKPSPHLDSLTSPTINPSLQLCVQRVKAFFAERPISTRRAIFNSYLIRHGPGNAESPSENWRPILRFALPYVCYMFKSGPFRDAYVLLGVDPRKEQKWAKYQTAIFNFRTGKWRNKAAIQEDVEELWDGRFNHLFTGKEVHTKVVAYGFPDILDPILRRLLDESLLRDKFHVRNVLHQKLIS